MEEANADTAPAAGPAGGGRAPGGGQDFHTDHSTPHHTTAAAAAAAHTGEPQCPAISEDDKERKMSTQHTTITP